MAYINGKEILFAPTNKAAAVKLQDVKAVEITKNETVEILPDAGNEAVKKVVLTVNVPDSPLPVEIATESEMTALLESAPVGSVYKYTGTTGTYENGALYVIEESE